MDTVAIRWKFLGTQQVNGLLFCAQQDVETPYPLDFQENLERVVPWVEKGLGMSYLVGYTQLDIMAIAKVHGGQAHGSYGVDFVLSAYLADGKASVWSNLGGFEIRTPKELLAYLASEQFGEACRRAANSALEKAAAFAARRREPAAPP
jgi:hypothetical protein